MMQMHPAVERILTFNAAENDHMLAINVALGFRPEGTTASGSAGANRHMLAAETPRGLEPAARKGERRKRLG